MVNTAGAVECTLDLGERIFLAYVHGPHAVGMPICVVGAADVHLAVQATVAGSISPRDRTFLCPGCSVSLQLAEQVVDNITLAICFPMLPQMQQAMHDAHGPVDLMMTFSWVLCSQVLEVFLTFCVQVAPFAPVVLVVLRE